MLNINPDEWDHIVVPISGGKDSQCVLSLAVQTPGVRSLLRVVQSVTWPAS